MSGEKGPAHATTMRWIAGKRRVGVALALGADIEDARAKARRVAATVRVDLPTPM